MLFQKKQIDPQLYGRMDEILPPDDSKYSSFHEPPPGQTPGETKKELIAQLMTSSYTTVIEGQSQNFPNLEGFLDKKGEFGVKAFKSRYFVLKEDQLIYYQDKIGRDCERVLGYLHLPDVSKFDLIQNKKK